VFVKKRGAQKWGIVHKEKLTVKKRRNCLVRRFFLCTFAVRYNLK
jgi:hypothetical protein